MRRSCFLLISLVGLTLGIHGQNPTPTPVPSNGTVRVSTNLIQIDISVTDKNGRPIRDLKPDDFEIYENEKKQEVSNFAFIAEANRPDKPEQADPNIPVPATVLRPENVKRTIALVVDDNTLSFESTAYVRQALKKFINEQMMDGDLIAIIRTAGGIGALQQFTSDKQQLMASDRADKVEPFEYGPNELRSDQRRGRYRERTVRDSFNWSR
ncbi:MAG: VWA domain-containing protein [Pyrinomonadaceae bacterium]